MDIQVDFQSGIPLVDQIARQVLARIRSGELKPGEQLPTTREMAVKLGVNFNTVARAYRLLDQAGVISTQAGRGTFILDPQVRQEAKGKTPEQIKALTRFYIEHATNLGFKPEEIRDCFEKMVQEDQS